MKTSCIKNRLLTQSYAQFRLFRKGSGTSFSTIFCVWFFKKMFHMLYSYNWPNFIANRDNVRVPIKFWGELKRWFILKNRPIHIHINSPSVIRPVNWNQLSFSSIEINNSHFLPSPQCLVYQIQVQKLTLANSLTL